MREGISIVIFVLAVGIGVAISGCSSSQGPAVPHPTSTTAVETTVPQTIQTESPGLQPSATPGPEVTIDLSARNFAFDRRLLTVPSGALVTINFDNRDNGISHNFALYENSSASLVIYRGEIITGPHAITYNFVAPAEAGTYYYQCDPHATTMNGDFVVI